MLAVTAWIVFVHLTRVCTNWAPNPSHLLSILYSYGRQQKTMRIDVTEQSFLAVVHVIDCCITNMDMLFFYTEPRQKKVILANFVQTQLDQIHTPYQDAGNAEHIKLRRYDTCSGAFMQFCVRAQYPMFSRVHQGTKTNQGPTVSFEQD